MLKKVMTAGLASAMMFSAAHADDPAPETDAPEFKPVSIAECTLEGEAPKMPKAKEASAEDRAAVIAGIKAYQANLSAYRVCLDLVADNEELEPEARQEAVSEFNRTVELETKMVEGWQKFDKKYQKANK